MAVLSIVGKSLFVSLLLLASQQMMHGPYVNQADICVRAASFGPLLEFPAIPGLPSHRHGSILDTVTR